MVAVMSLSTLNTTALTYDKQFSGRPTQHIGKLNSHLARAASRAQVS